MPRNYSRTRAWGCAANAGGWLPAPTAVMSWCPENGTGSSRKNMAIIGIDFDGTCVTDLFPYVGDNIGAASVLRKLADKNLLILYTVRDGKYLQDAVDWFKYNHINLYSVNYNPEPVSSSPKLYCDYYIDDRNIGTPLTDKGYVDWNKMLVLLRQKNLL